MAKDCRVSSKPEKKLGHCPLAVQRDVTSVNKCVKFYKSKNVCSIVANNGTSIKWRADWARFQGKTYTQVLQSNINRHCGSWVQTKSKFKFKDTSSGESQSKPGTTSTVAVVSFPVHANCITSL